MAGKNDGRKRRGNAGDNDSGASASGADDGRQRAGHSDSAGSGEIVVGSGALDQGVGGSAVSDSGSAGDSRHSTLGSSDAGAGAGAGGGGGGDRAAGGGEGEKRRRGRPRKDGLDSSGAPRLVPLSKLRGGKKGKRKDYTKFFARAFGFAFDVPKILGYGDHWSIDDDTAFTLGSKFNDCIAELPKSASGRFWDFVDKWVGPTIPFASFGFTLYVVTEPRIAATRVMIKEKADRDANRANSPIAQDRSSASDAGVHEGAGGGFPEAGTGDILRYAAERERFARDVGDPGQDSRPFAAADSGVSPE